MSAARQHKPHLAKEIAAIIKAGLFPHLVQRPDGSLELTGLPADKVVSPDYEAEDLGRKIDAVGRGGGDSD